MKKILFLLVILLMPGGSSYLAETATNTQPVSGQLMQFGGISWRILDIDGEYALLIHDLGIFQPFHDILEDVTWETSHARDWLNNEFYNSFSETDRARIRETYLINDDNPLFGTPGGANTTDKIFILSLEEAMRFYDGDGWFINRVGGRYADSSSGQWWLRTPGATSNMTEFVNDFASLNWMTFSIDGVWGNVTDFGIEVFNIEGEDVNHWLPMLRPVMWVRLEETPAPTLSINYEGEIINFGGRNWMVLELQDDRALVLHETVMPNLRYHFSENANEWSWGDSLFRRWLNTEFYFSFSEADRERIILTTTTNSGNPWKFVNFRGHSIYPVYDGNTEDFIFFLSVDEVLHYFGDSGMVELGKANKNRVLGWVWSSRPEMGIYAWSIHDNYSESRTAFGELDWINMDQNRNSRWFLRTTGGLRGAVAIDRDGGIALEGEEVDGINTGLRPAMWLRLD